MQQTKAAQDVLAERRRQVESEGWTPEHDDEHASGALADAAACYAVFPVAGTELPKGYYSLWPWDRGWWKPKDRRSNLVKAGALILAEIERLDRAAQKAQQAALASQPKPAPVLLTDEEIHHLSKYGTSRDLESAVLRKNGWGE